MTIYIGADHRGFKLKDEIKEAFKNGPYTIVDVGNERYVEDDDFPDFAAAVAAGVAGKGDEARGIVLCGSGFGVDIAANKIKGIRSALASSPDHAYQARHDDDANVLAIAADFTKIDDAVKIIKVFLSTPFAKDERYQRRLDKIAKLEQ